MRKLTTLFYQSFQEFKDVRTLTVAALLGAVSIVLGYYTLVIGDYLKIGFSNIAGQIVYYLFGPAFGAFFGGALDVLKYLIKPTGAFFPGFTLNAILAGVLYGLFFYKKSISFKRILIAELTVCVICNMFLGTYWLTILYGEAFLVLLPMRALKNIVMWPVNSMLFYVIAKALEASRVFQPLREKKAGL